MRSWNAFTIETSGDIRDLFFFLHGYVQNWNGSNFVLCFEEMNIICF